MAGFPQAVRELVYARAGYRCELRGCRAEGGSVHHRRPRGMGGSKDPVTSSPANALLLCGSGTTGCHGWVESHRTEARDLDLLVLQHADPREVPVQIAAGVVYLDEHGGYVRAEVPS